MTALAAIGRAVLTSLTATGLAALLAGAAVGQGLSLKDQDSDEPIEIYAEEGIEWQRQNKAYVARGNARASRGTASVRAETLTAFYRPSPAGGTEIWRIDADGGVRLTSGDDLAYGDKAVYLVDEQRITLTGKVGLKTAQDSITADRSLEYWERDLVMVATGNAVATRADRRLKADKLTMFLREEAGGKLALSRADARGNVHVSTKTDIATGNCANYDVDRGLALLVGSVKITRGENQLNGDAAEVNLNTGISTLHGKSTAAAASAKSPCARAMQKQGRVQGLFLPGSEKLPGQTATQ